MTHRIAARVACLVLLISLHPLASRSRVPSGRHSRITHALSDEIPSLAAIIIERHDSIEIERYFHGVRPDSAFHIMSVTKSFVSAIAGAAYDRGLFRNLDTAVLSVMPEYGRPSRSLHTIRGWKDNERNDSLRRTLTMRHLLTMQTGLDWSDFGPNMDLFSVSSDPVRFALDVPFDTNPGAEFNYCSGGASVFAAGLARIVGGDLLTFGDSAIFRPAGIRIEKWETDPEGRRLGAAAIYTTPRDLLRLGELYLHRGRQGGKQILSEEWIDASLAKHAELTDWDVTPNVDGYGYFWWRRKSHGHEVYYASGFGGQLIYVIPDLDAVMVTVCSLDKHNRGREEIKKLHHILDGIIQQWVQ